ncbi:Flp family type IVb pilin [Sphingomonas sp. JC676]|uniref:Flp family type IVb pilin n=1 Tax=Sphingomonas sp. JC676 TaxID=2768065 RepID=UPI0016579A66|nr:Flp family type IVb pilin [Sphingomonas sp. JC676]MBC9031064.1 Flp family type IVb pilin [Sphingomonas sp. JC676]
MRAPIRFFRTLISDQRGATVIEYGLILALIVLALMSALIALAGVTTDMWINVSDKVQSAH